jgi:hypothetical protein
MNDETAAPPPPTELSVVQTQMNQTANEVSDLFSTIFSLIDEVETYEE